MKMQFETKTVRLVILGAIFLLGIYVLYLIRGILLPFFLALILAYILNPLVLFLEDYRFTRTTALLVVYIIGILALLVTFIYGIPIVVRELTDLGRAVPHITFETQQFLFSVYEKYRSIPMPENVSRIINDSISSFEIAVTQGIQTILDSLVAFLSHLLSILLAPILTFYLLKDWDHIGRKIISLFPIKWKEPIMSLWEEIDRVLIGFIRGHLLVATVVGVLTGIGLKIIGMDYIILLSFITGISNIIPYFGPIIGAVPVIALALLESMTLALQAVIVMVVVQQVESNLVSPAILGDSVGLHPVTIIFVLLAGGSLFGILGLLFSVPVAAILRIIIGYIYSNLVS